METRSEMEADCEDADACICCSKAYESFEEITSAQKYQGLLFHQDKLVEKEKLMDAKLSEKYGNAEVYQAYLLHRDKLVEKEKEVKEKLKLSEAKLSANYSAKLSEKYVVQVVCELLKSGSATCQCTECRGEHCPASFPLVSPPHSPSEGSVHSEDCLDWLTTTDV